MIRPFIICIILLTTIVTCNAQITTSVYIKGTGYNYNQARVVKVGGTNYAVGGRGLTLTVLNAGTHAHISTVKYDTHGSTTDANSLADALNKLTRGQIGIIASQDSWEDNVTENLKTAGRRLGLYKLTAGASADNRHPYAAIFRGSGTSSTTNNEPNHIAYEVVQSDDAQAEYAVIATYLIDDAFIGNNITNALVSGDGSISGPSVLVDGIGQVGIGTSSPAYKLDVVGQLRAGSVDMPPAIFNRNGNGFHTVFQRGGVNQGYFGTHNSTTSFFLTSYDDFALRVNGSGNDSFYMNSSGDVGIGTSLPGFKLDVNGTSRFTSDMIAQKIKFTTSGTVQPVLSRNSTGGLDLDVDGIANSSNAFQVKEGSNIRFKVQGDGNVGIGTSSPAYKLDVNGTSRFSQNMIVQGNLETTKVKVTAAPGSVPDYVFAKDYSLITLEEVEDFIQKNNHLPNIPNALTIEANGQNLGEMQLKLLEKIEELTLYAIKADNEKETLKAKNSQLQVQFEDLLKRIEKLEKENNGNK